MYSISDLIPYVDIDQRTHENILFGNGFSIGVDSRFSYPSLHQIASQNRELSLSDKKLFEKFETFDFEQVLRRLVDALDVNKSLGNNATEMEKRYKSIRNALIKSVETVHPTYDAVAQHWLEAVAFELREYKRIFTTNYDLILYWILGSLEFKGFTDFFWAKDMEFNPLNVDKWNDEVTESYYLHGALFIFSDAKKTYKLKRTTVNKLQHHIKSVIRFRRDLPVFVSEGRSSQKLQSIKRSPYLSFAHRQFQMISSGLVIYGHSLNAKADSHIIGSINSSQIRVIAVSIFTSGKSEKDIIAEMEDYHVKLRPFIQNGGTLQFFDCDTSPFLYGGEDVVSQDLLTEDLPSEQHDDELPAWLKPDYSTEWSDEDDLPF